MTTRLLIIGGLREDYSITHDGQVRLGVLGGNAVYAAAGAAVWATDVAVVSRVGSNFPPEWLEQVGRRGIDLSGVRVLPDPQDTRTFYAYLTPEQRVDTNPTAHFLRLGLQLPERLRDYQTSTAGQEQRSQFGPLAVRPGDLDFNGLPPAAAHLAPADYLTHSLVPARLRQLGVARVTVDPSMRYMEPGFRKELPVLLNGLNAFLPSEAEVFSFFQPHPPDSWEMAEALAAFGCPIVVIKRGAAGQHIWDQASRRRWQVPAYPARVVDVTGAGDAYCGGFLAGLHETGDPLEAGLRGSVSASLAVEGSGPLYPMGAAPGLAQARLQALRTTVREM